MRDVLELRPQAGRPEMHDPWIGVAAAVIAAAAIAVSVAEAGGAVRILECVAGALIMAAGAGTALLPAAMSRRMARIIAAERDEEATFGIRPVADEPG